MDSPTSSSSSSSPSDTSLISNRNCQICSQPGHGTHFGAYSCRACSAFFRRAILANYSILKCREMNGKCVANSDGRFNCKACRLQRCYDSGMRPEQLQIDRDKISSTQQQVKKPNMLRNIPHSPENFLGRPSFIFSLEPDLASTNKTLIDVQFLIDHAANLFNSNTNHRMDSTMIGMSTLDRLTYALDLSRIPSLEKPVICKKVGMKERLLFWESKFLATANWLTYCDEFQQLPLEIKIELLKSIWFIWMKLDKVGKKVEMKANSEVDQLCHIMHNIYIEIDKVQFDDSWMTNYRTDQIQYFLDKPNPAYKSNILDPLCNICASSQEITYLICVVSFRYAAKQNPGLIANLSEMLIEKLANDLHSYYHNERKLKNYASRMATLMKITRFLENDIYERKQRAEIARVFDVFRIEFSHPEMFIGV